MFNTRTYDDDDILRNSRDNIPFLSNKNAPESAILSHLEILISFYIETYVKHTVLTAYAYF